MASYFKINNTDDRFQAEFRTAGHAWTARTQDQIQNTALLGDDLNFHTMHPAGNPIYVRKGNDSHPKILLNSANAPAANKITVYNKNKLSNNEYDEFIRVVRANWDDLRALALNFYNHAEAPIAVPVVTPKRRCKNGKCGHQDDDSKFATNAFGKRVCPKCGSTFSG